MIEQGHSPHSSPEAWRRYASGALAGGSVLITLTLLFFVMGRLPLSGVAVVVLLSLALIGFGLYATRRAWNR